MFEQSMKAKAIADRELSQEAKQLLDSIDVKVRPFETAKHFPPSSIAWRLFEKKPLARDDYFMELMINRRGTRKRFQRRVAAEIAALQEYYSNIGYPKTSRNVWDKGDQ